MIKVYVANLHAYNSGELYGEWVELPASQIKIQEVEQRVLSMHPGSEELFIADYENDFGFMIDEYDSINELNEWANELENYVNEHGLDVVSVILAECVSDVEEALDILREGRFNVYHDVRTEYDLGYEVAEAMGIITCRDNILERYFDYEAFGRDLTYEGIAIYPNYAIAVDLNA